MVASFLNRLALATQGPRGHPPDCAMLQTGLCVRGHRAAACPPQPRHDGRGAGPRGTALARHRRDAGKDPRKEVCMSRLATFAFALATAVGAIACQPPDAPSPVVPSAAATAPLPPPLGATEAQPSS